MRSFFTFIFTLIIIAVAGQQNRNAIVGRWIATDNSVAVQVYTVGQNFRAKVVWINEKLGSGTPIHSRVDSENPNSNLRSRKIMGMDVLEGLNYNSSKDRWENGKIYDASSGRTWDSHAEIKSNGQLFVRGYWKFSWIGKTLTFRRF